MVEFKEYVLGETRAIVARGNRLEIREHIASTAVAIIMMYLEGIISHEDGKEITDKVFAITYDYLTDEEKAALAKKTK